MKQITQTQKLADILHDNYLLIPVINRFGIRLGFGEKTVGAVCAERAIDPEFFIAVLNAFGCENYAPAKKLRPQHVPMIVAYLRRTHAYYRRSQVPTIERSIGLLIRSASRSGTDLSIVKDFFRDYKTELFHHLKREETVTFPYIETVSAQFNGSPAPHPSKLPDSETYSMRIYGMEHTNMDEKLNDLKNILIKYITGNFDETVCNAIVFELFRLEKDLQDHTRIEDHILRPLVAGMEAQLGRQKSGRRIR